MFTTTLTVSPHKKSSKINEIGQNIGNSLFLAADFKKKDGFNRAIQFAKEMLCVSQGFSEPGVLSGNKSNGCRGLSE